MSQLQSSRGTKLVALKQLREIEAPAPSGRWRPIRHVEALEIVESALESQGYQVVERRPYVYRDDARFIALLDLDAEVSECASLVVGLTSSTDQSLPLGFFAGHRSRVTGCSTFTANFSLKCKHTLAGTDRFHAEARAAAEKLEDYRELQRARIELMKRTPVDVRAGDSLILRAFERGIVTLRALKDVVQGWRRPPFEEFETPTLRSIESIIAAVLERSGASEVYRRHVKATMKLNALIDSELKLGRSADVEAS